eukprot:1912832-Rhodomonas_salina.1
MANLRCMAEIERDLGRTLPGVKGPCGETDYFATKTGQVMTHVHPSTLNKPITPQSFSRLRVLGVLTVRFPRAEQTAKRAGSLRSLHSHRRILSEHELRGSAPALAAPGQLATEPRKLSHASVLRARARRGRAGRGGCLLGPRNR